MTSAIDWRLDFLDMGRLYRAVGRVGYGSSERRCGATARIATPYKPSGEEISLLKNRVTSYFSSRDEVKYGTE